MSDDGPLDMNDRDDRLSLGHFVVGRLCGAMADAGRVLAVLPEDEFMELTAAEREACDHGENEAARGTARMLVDLYETLRRGSQQAQQEAQQP